MNTDLLLRADGLSKAPTAFLICLTILLRAVLLGWLVQRGFGSVEVTNASYPNYNGISVRAKPLKPVFPMAANPYPASSTFTAISIIARQATPTASRWRGVASWS